MFLVEGHKPEKPQLSYEKILEKYKEKGERLEKRFAIQIKQAKNGCFKYIGVSSSDEIDDVLEGEKFPVGFHYSIGLEGYCGEELDMNIEDTVHKYIEKKEEKLPFWIYLEKDKEDNV